MLLEINFKAAGMNFAAALANALEIDVNRVYVAVTPPVEKIPFCADWRVVQSCPDVVAYVDGEKMLLNWV